MKTIEQMEGFILKHKLFYADLIIKENEPDKIRFAAMGAAKMCNLLLDFMEAE